MCHVVLSDSDKELLVDRTTKSRKNNVNHNKNKDDTSCKKDRKDDKESTKGKKSKQTVTVANEFISAARAIACCINLWCNVDKVIKVAQMLEQDEAGKNGELKEDEASRKLREDRLAKYDKDTREHYVFTYQRILQVVPSLKSIIDNPKHTAELAGITQKMNETIHSTQSVNATSLKKHIAQYLPPNPHKAGLNPPIVNGSGQAEMGLKHPILARFLCPADKLEEYNRDPAGTCKLLECGKIPMTAANFPAVLWSGNNYLGDDWDMTDMDKGFFRSYVARHIFLGPTSALKDEGKKGSKQSNCDLHDMVTVEPEHIAYVCVQTRFGISSMSVWSEKDGEFSYRDFYHYIITYIHNAVDRAWRDNLIKWWNVQLFGNEQGRVYNADMKKEAATSAFSDSEPRAMTMMEKMRAQMEARMIAQASAHESGGAAEGGHSDRHIPSSPTSTHGSNVEQAEEFSPWQATISPVHSSHHSRARHQYYQQTPTLPQANASPSRRSQCWAVYTVTPTPPRVSSRRFSRLAERNPSPAVSEDESRGEGPP
ncbi:hypothetical protein J3R82DRAFT_4654 [Butyriboletus roseoflavus]|nr:hypothetical protein J3R82DRAFT_4654 [Butyriboletus roseoflavus]